MAYQPRYVSAPNFRDLGGMPAADGRQTRFGTLFRSEAPPRFSAGDLDDINDLGISVVVDLRAAVECSDDESRLAARRVRIPALPEVRTGGAELINELISDSTGELARQNMIWSYSTMPEVFAPHFAGLVTEIIDGGLPMLVHCTAGKDRSGFVVAMLLTAVGVDPEAIAQDYEISRQVQTREVLRSLLVGPAARSGTGGDVVIADEVLDAMAADRKYLEVVYRAAADMAGSLEDYITQTGQLDDRRRALLRDALLD